MRVLVTGSQGMIGYHVCRFLCENKHDVLGVDNCSKYEQHNDNLSNFAFHKLDIVNDTHTLERLGHEFKPDCIIALAAIVGSSDYFNKFAYEVLANNDRILISTFDLAISLYAKNILNKIVVISSSIIFDSLNANSSSDSFLPKTVYGFQKLATEYFCKAASDQYGLKYNIVRPFNCVGVTPSIPKFSHNVVIDLVLKSLRCNQDDCLPIYGTGEQVRYYTDAKDVARGIAMVMESEYVNEDFNISSNNRISVKELASIIWKKIHNTEVCFDHLISRADDVLERIPDVSKAKSLLGFEAKITIEDTIDEIVKVMMNATT